FEIRKAEIARREIVLFEIERIVWDVHFSIQPLDFSAGADDRRGVVIEARCAPFKQRRYDYNPQFARQLPQCFGGWSRDRLSQRELIRVFFPAEILRAE